ncbi:MAG: hypothetical protein ACRCWQ_02690 [Bacilli bacterium]
MATGASGKVYLYGADNKPELGGSGWINMRNADTYTNIKVDLEGMDWKDTLVHYEGTEPKMLSYTMKEIDFHGLKVTVPSYGFVAMRADGRVHWFEVKPMIDETEFRTGGYSSFVIGKASIPKLNWKESLVKIIN